jgi:hypothetical protein
VAARPAWRIEVAAERSEVVADTLASVERIVDALDPVRRSAGAPPYRIR